VVPEVLAEGLAPPELARIANDEHKLAREAGESMLEHAFRAGHSLTAAKRQLRHGEWIPWLEANFEGTPRIAQHYMKVAANTKRVSHMGEPSLRKAIKAISDTKGDGELVQQSTTNEWYTPAKYLDAARLVLGDIDLDPASCPEANETVQAARFLTEEDDGLTFEWHGRVWLNPPYGRLAGDFVSYLADEFEAGHTKAAVALVNAHCTDTSWFQRLWRHILCFTDHRIDFAAGTDGRSGSTHGSVFAYLGPDPDAFAREFSAFGAIVARWP
jgi:phage N-6-adenine-methyltransferase